MEVSPIEFGGVTEELGLHMEEGLIAGVSLGGDATNTVWST